MRKRGTLWIIYRENRGLFRLYLLFFVLGLLMMSYYQFDRVKLHLVCNHFHAPWLDTFMAYFTHLGDGYFMALLTLCLLFYRLKYGLGLTMVGVLLAPLVYSLKQSFNHLRPGKVFSDLGLLGDLYMPIPFDDLNLYNSFPSGHAAVSMGTCMILAFLVDSKKIKYGLVVLGLFLSYTRVYLNQHFLEDIVLGSLVGLLMAFLVYFIMVYLKLLRAWNVSLQDWISRKKE